MTCGFKSELTVSDVSHTQPFLSGVESRRAACGQHLTRPTLLQASRPDLFLFLRSAISITSSSCQSWLTPCVCVCACVRMRARVCVYRCRKHEPCCRGQSEDNSQYSQKQSGQVSLKNVQRLCFWQWGLKLKANKNTTEHITICFLKDMWFWTWIQFS